MEKITTFIPLLTAMEHLAILFLIPLPPTSSKS